MILLAQVMRKISFQRGKLHLLKFIPVRQLATKGYFNNHIFVTSNGIKWDASTLPDLITTPLFWCGTYQDDVQTCLKLCLQKGDVVFDIGAHFGLMSMVASRIIGDSGKVVAFEPNPQSRRILEEHLKLNQIHNATIEPIGLLDKTGELDFYATEASANSTFVKPFAESRQFYKIVAPVDTLDRYVKRSGLRPKLLKIDIEGSEYECLRGGQETCSSLKPIVLTEFNPISQRSTDMNERRVLHLLESFGYKFFLPKRSFWGTFGHGFDQISPDSTFPARRVPNVLCIHNSDKHNLGIVERHA
jgi:FkbM family methyltransferase